MDSGGPTTEGSAWWRTSEVARASACGACFIKELYAYAEAQTAFISTHQSLFPGAIPVDIPATPASRHRDRVYSL